MFVEDLNADFNAADFDDKESNGDEIFMQLAAKKLTPMPDQIKPGVQMIQVSYQY